MVADFDASDFAPIDWSANASTLYTNSFALLPSFEDPIAQRLYNEAYHNRSLSSDERVRFRENLNSYLLDTYGIDFNRVYDWEAFRDAGSW